MFKCLVICISCAILPATSWAQSQLIVWNVGQGQWITEVHADHCVHYDLGGEFDVTMQALKLCRGKKNILHLSHWDWDHISFAAGFARQAFDACLSARPAGLATRLKLRLISEIRLCNSAEKLSEKIPDYQTLFTGEGQTQANDASSVVYSRAFRTLIPGDSTRAMEKRWLWETSGQTEGLILGHHGSRTSSSPALLEHLPHLKWAVASARKARYGHPHLIVRETLREMHIPLLRTEDWGNLHFLKEAGKQ